MNPTGAVNDEKKRLKLEGALEMASAMSDKINEPLTTITFLLELLLEEIDKTDPKHEKLRQIVDKVYVLGQMARQIHCVWKYETTQSVTGQKIIDLDKSSSPCASGDSIFYEGEQWPANGKANGYLKRA